MPIQIDAYSDGQLSEYSYTSGSCDTLDEILKRFTLDYTPEYVLKIRDTCVWCDVHERIWRFLRWFVQTTWTLCSRWDGIGDCSQLVVLTLLPIIMMQERIFDRWCRSEIPYGPKSCWSCSGGGFWEFWHLNICITGRYFRTMLSLVCNICAGKAFE